MMSGNASSQRLESYPTNTAQVGAVVIGRNEGERLATCLHSLLTLIPMGNIVYVDSGSVDRSCDVARKLEIHVVELDLSIPFTAARARNQGAESLYEMIPDIQYIQFIDGDCELVEGWLEAAIEMLGHDDTLAVVCGRRRERYPDATPYNRLADMEWDTPVGDAMACGGDALIRQSAFEAVQGYNAAFICGEEPEMCIRLRREGWRIRRLDEEMTWHDADMKSFSQWWRRSIRGGWAVAEGEASYGNAAEQYMVRENRSGWLWGLVIPVIILGLLLFSKGLSLIGLLGYGVLGWRIYRYRIQKGDIPAHARLYAVFCTLSKFPQMIGQLTYWVKRWRGQTATLIEYKQPVTKGA